MATPTTTYGTQNGTQPATETAVVVVKDVPRRSRKVPIGGFLPAGNSFDKELTHYTTAELKLFDSIIQQDLAFSIYELEKYKLTFEPQEDIDHTGKWIEQFNKTDDISDTENAIMRQEKYIQHLEKALERIADGTYGVCKTSGKLIHPDRLFVQPVATEEVDVKKQRENVITYN